MGLQVRPHIRGEHNIFSNEFVISETWIIADHKSPASSVVEENAATVFDEKMQKCFVDHETLIRLEWIKEVT